MANPRSKRIALLDTTSKEKLEVTVSYDVGGMSMWDYKEYPRGYWLTVTPVEINDYAVERGYTTTSFTLGSGIKTLITKATRFGAKAMARAADAAAEKLPELVAAVCQKQGLTLAN
jgi:hypothetical protein